jgi:hypothetical protein
MTPTQSSISIGRARHSDSGSVFSLLFLCSCEKQKAKSRNPVKKEEKSFHGSLVFLPVHPSDTDFVSLFFVHLKFRVLYVVFATIKAGRRRYKKNSQSAKKK